MKHVPSCSVICKMCNSPNPFFVVLVACLKQSKCKVNVNDLAEYKTESENLYLLGECQRKTPVSHVISICQIFQSVLLSKEIITERLHTNFITFRNIS